MIFCPSIAAADPVPTRSRSNKQSIINVFMRSVPRSSPPPPRRIRLPGTPVSILDFAAMTSEQQKVWLEERGAKSTSHAPAQWSGIAVQHGESALEDTTKSSVQLSQPLDDSSISSSSYASDCEDDKAVPSNSKRSIFTPYWHRSEHDNSLAAKEVPSSVSHSPHQRIRTSRPRRSLEQPLEDVIAAAIELSHAPVFDDAPRRLSAVEPATILPNLLRDLSFADALLSSEQALQPRNTPPPLSHSRSIDSLKSLSSILKNGSSSSSLDPPLVKSNAKCKPPVSFDPRVQVIVFLEDIPPPPPLKLPSWVSRSLKSLLYELGSGEDS
jgi:hypothetical protein